MQKNCLNITAAMFYTCELVRLGKVRCFWFWMHNISAITLAILVISSYFTPLNKSRPTETINIYFHLVAMFGGEVQEFGLVTTIFDVHLFANSW